MKKRAFTLIEILVTIAIIAILAVVSATLYPTVQEKFATHSTEQTIKLLVAGLEQYYDFWGEFPLIKDGVNDEVVIDDYYGQNYTKQIFEDLCVPDASTVSLTGTIDDITALNQAAYFLLNKTPTVKSIIAKIDTSMVTAKDNDSVDMILNVDGREYPLFRVNDDWETALRYTYDKDNDSFPLIESAGPDRKFGDGSSAGDGEDESYAEDNVSSLDI